MLVGSDETNFKAVEAAIGRQVDVIRSYVWNGANFAKLTGYANAGYIVHASYKFRTAAGAVIQSSTIPTHAIDGDLDAFDNVMIGLKKNSKGKHRKGYEHEEDAKAAAASGNAAQLNAAINYCIGRNRTRALAAGLQDFVCWTGFDLLNREPQYRAAGNAADVIMLDPYELAAYPNWQSLLAAYKQDFDYIKKIYPGKFMCLGEINAPNPPASAPNARVQWLNQARTDLETNYPEVDVACLWQDIGGGNLTLSATELAGLKTGFFAPGITIPTGVQVPIAAITALQKAQAAYDTAKAVYQAAVTARENSWTSYNVTETTAMQAEMAYTTAADALEVATKVITG